MRNVNKCNGKIILINRFQIRQGVEIRLYDKAVYSNVFLIVMGTSNYLLRCIDVLERSVRVQREISRGLLVSPVKESRDPTQLLVVFGI